MGKTVGGRFVESDYRLRDLLRIVATSEQFFEVSDSTAASSQEVQ